jgi:uncharacterized membrane protein YfcA
MGPLDAALVGGAGLLAGAVNAVAGGGTLIAFPALLGAGLPAITANITSSVGLVTGYAGGAAGYRRELAGQAGRLRALGGPALLGGLIGAVVLLVTPSDAFRALVPYLVLVACLLLAAQSRLANWVTRRRGEPSAEPRAGAPDVPAVDSSGAAQTADPAAVGSVTAAPVAPVAVDVVGTVAAVDAVTWPTRIGVLAAGVYGSYFGAGLGVLLLGVLGILLADDLQRMNALKTLLSFGMNAVGVLVFLVAAQVSWAAAGILVGTSAVGGVCGARVARRLPAAALRAAVILLGVTVAVIMLVRG